MGWRIDLVHVLLKIRRKHPDDYGSLYDAEMTTSKYSLVAVTTVSSQHTRKTTDFCQACRQQPKNA